MTNLLPLPEPDVTIYDSPGGYDFAYTEDQMRAYALAHQIAERERCIDICNQYFTIEGIAQDIKSAIKGTP
jgi:hypothetical protein